MTDRASRAGIPQVSHPHTAPFSHDIPVVMDEALAQKAREVNTRTGSLPVFLEAPDQTSTSREDERGERHTAWENERAEEHQHG